MTRPSMPCLAGRCAVPSGFVSNARVQDPAPPQCRASDDAGTITARSIAERVRLLTVHVPRFERTPSALEARRLQPDFGVDAGLSRVESKRAVK